MKTAFSTYHPIVNFVYFAFVLLFTMLFLHPAALLISFSGAFAWSVRMGGKAALRTNFRYMLPLLLVTALLNPAFNHEGATILTYLPTGNPLTLESIVYGVVAAVMLLAAICWFSCFNNVITSDKFIYLFGRIIPALSLVLSMALRFVPRFLRQFRVVSDAQKCVGRDVSNGSVIQRAKHGARILSIVVTWSLENAIETADSMKSRGHGLKGRTAFSIYRFDERDKTALFVICALGLFVFSMLFAGGFSARYFPTFQMAPPDAWSIAGLLAYAGLCSVPLVLDLREARKWRTLVQTEDRT